MESGAKANAEQLDYAGNDYFMVYCWQVYEIIKINSLMALNYKRLYYFTTRRRH
ncbi:hypothetical protein [Methanosarcina barkeri]|uniref:hypothetical protein n=1 Tax=Methanosarcina barkeri TaxID=2208 RepID=UPI000ABC8CAF|nr:hypothetical protein [Methanosarcina barkeri]